MNRSKAKKSLQRTFVICAPGYEQIDEQWFCPDFWEDRATSVASGGRGSAWFISSQLGEFVLRHYRRGGLIARVSQRRYFFTGNGRARPFVEFKLLQRLRARGLPVPKPVAAIVSRSGIFGYEGAILIERIEGAQPMPEHPALENENLWRSVGQTIGRFHREGLEHVDLNCDNILVSDKGVYIIDFDRCKLHGQAEGAKMIGWKKSNLSRLHRSVEKRCKHIPNKKREALWQILVSSYHHSDSGEAH